MLSERAAVSWEILHQEGFYPEESSGLFVGISTFEDGRFAPVRFAVDDAIDLAWVFVLELGLLDARRCVLALSGEPQKQISAERLTELLAAGARTERPRLREVYRLATELSQSGGERGLFLLSVATHGLSDQGGDYLVAADSLRDRLLKTGIEVKDLFDLAAKSLARRRLVVLDACRERLSEGTSSLAGAAMSKSFAGAISRATGLTVLSAATVGGYAYDDTSQQNGVFSGALVAGLRGAAPADGRGFITVATLAQYAQERVLSWVRMHRQEHVTLSRGIEKRFDETAEQLPLAIDPQRSRTMAEYQRRRALALVRLKENIGEILDGRSFDEMKVFLPSGGLPSPEAEKLLKGIEALDGGEITQRSLLHLFGELQRPQVLKKRGFPKLWVVASVLVLAFGVFGWMQLARDKDPAPQLPEKEIEADSKLADIKPAQVDQPAPSTRIGQPEIQRQKTEAKPPESSATTPKKSSSSPAGRTQEPVTRPEAQAEPKAGERVLDSFGMAYRYIPGGKYTIGSPASDKERYSWEQEPHEVAVKGFWLAETELTQAEWKRHGFVNPSKFTPCDNCPVERVSWNEAVMFADELSKKAGLESCYEPESCTGELGTKEYNCKEVRVQNADCSGYRLPTEEEWEVAARAQLPGAAYLARYGESDAIAWHSGNSGSKPHAVGQKTANAWGLHDMLGNVSEWTNSTWMGSNRVFRGGSWFDDTRDVRAAYRNRDGPGDYSGSLGFRFSLGRPRSGQEKEGRGAP